MFQDPPESRRAPFSPPDDSFLPTYLMLIFPARNWRRRRLAPSVAFEYPAPVMKPLLQSETTMPTLIHHFDEVFGVKIPLPALQRGWLHGRELTQPWHVEQIVEKLGDQCWFSHCVASASVRKGKNRSGGWARPGAEFTRADRDGGRRWPWYSSGDNSRAAMPVGAI